MNLLFKNCSKFNNLIVSYLGSIPITYGSSKLKEILPDEKTSIDIRDFENPEKLAIYLHALNQNDTEYDSNIDKILQIIKKQ